MTRNVTIVSAGDIVDEEQNLGREGHIPYPLVAELFRCTAQSRPLY